MPASIAWVGMIGAGAAGANSAPLAAMPGIGNSANRAPFEHRRRIIEMGDPARCRPPATESRARAPSRACRRRQARDLLLAAVAAEHADGEFRPVDVWQGGPSTMRDFGCVSRHHWRTADCIRQRRSGYYAPTAVPTYAVAACPAYLAKFKTAAASPAAPAGSAWTLASTSAGTSPSTSISAMALPPGRRGRHGRSRC